jgi:hypothetical protein
MEFVSWMISKKGQPALKTFKEMENLLFFPNAAPGK